MFLSLIITINKENNINCITDSSNKSNKLKSRNKLMTVDRLKKYYQILRNEREKMCENDEYGK